MSEDSAPKTTESEKKRKNSADLSSAPKHLKNNYYYPLSNEECDVEIINKFADHIQQNNKKEESINKKSNNNSLNNEKNNNMNNPTTNNQIKNKKIPPLNIYDVDIDQLIEFIKEGLKIKEFKIREFNRGNNKKLSLFMTSLTDYERVKKHLQTTRANFYTFTPKNEKTKTVLLKGLSANIETNEILNELLRFENENLKFIKVSQFATNKSTQNDINLPIFLIQISGNSKISELKSIKVLLHRCIYWEPLRKQGIPQCRRCQNFFHSAANCYKPPRCVKCNQSHESSACALKIPPNEREKLFCVLCNKHGHPASYKGCEKYKELQKRLQNKKQMMKQNRINKPHMFLNNNISYANILKNNNNNIENNFNLDNLNKTTPINRILEDLKNTIQNVATQILNLQKQIELQAARIDTIYSFLEI
ncbi:Nucleic-acid-binding protein from transposon X-element [Lucilia cuprina]|nr:Nucleic-acid-binding protein from transposon X-element [Lucilia cuprina]